MKFCIQKEKNNLLKNTQIILLIKFN